ncbi:aldo/keto reductase [Spongiactinospora rosea]|uniref:Aldo/keto reductase n=1 Tax=Spongiactinospora rosea TaxID=2248750 RepID=A0A366M5S9_9ACTN|nr:aldo/keto reductase [Spongiactinospora rosea]RBQ20944.1 aldo/keto reductase [Spongiactinospora rosea]
MLGTGTSSTDLTAAGLPRAGGASTLAGRTVSRIGFGAMQLERLQGDRRTALALVRRAVELGVDHIDTADFYGNGFVNEVIREAIRPGDGVLVVTKVGGAPNPDGPIPVRPAQRPEELRASVEDNLRGLGLDRLPIVNLRRLDMGPGLIAEGDQAVGLDDQLAVLTALRDEGKIGAIGLSNVTFSMLRRALPAGIVCVQNAYNLLTRGDDDMLVACVAEGIAWVPFFPLGSTFAELPSVADEPAVRAVARSLGRTPAQVGLAWLLRRSPNVLLIPGTADAGHLAENVAAASITFDADTLAMLNAVPSRSADVPLR